MTEGPHLAETRAGGPVWSYSSRGRNRWCQLAEYLRGRVRSPGERYEVRRIMEAWAGIMKRPQSETTSELGLDVEVARWSGGQPNDGAAEPPAPAGGDPPQPPPENGPAEEPVPTSVTSSSESSTESSDDKKAPTKREEGADPRAPQEPSLMKCCFCEREITRCAKALRCRGVSFTGRVCQHMVCAAGCAGTWVNPKAPREGILCPHCQGQVEPRDPGTDIPCTPAEAEGYDQVPWQTAEVCVGSTEEWQRQLCPTCHGISLEGSLHGNRGAEWAHCRRLAPSQDATTYSLMSFCEVIRVRGVEARSQGLDVPEGLYQGARRAQASLNLLLAKRALGPPVARPPHSGTDDW